MSPSHAWAFSAGIFGWRGQLWDCWQIVLDADDVVEVLPLHGNKIGEIRIGNSVPKSRIWLVGTRAVPARGRRW